MQMKIKQHKESGLWVREDGAVLMPPCPNIHRFKHTWTYGYKRKNGYMVVQFRGKKYKVHRLVAEAFLGDPPFSGATVDHINRDKTANFVSNLRWADYKTQADNKQNVNDSLEKYGVRRCEDSAEYQRAYYANNPEFAKRKCTYNREYYLKQKALGKRVRTCPDGSRQWLTDEEFDARYKNG
jgi:hypothetical protein